MAANCAASLKLAAAVTTDQSISPAYARRCFEITVSGTNGAADLKLYAPASMRSNVANNDLPTIAEGDLALYRYTGSAWAELTSVNGNSGDGFSFASAQTPGFSNFLVGKSGGGDEPTAVSLQSIAVATPSTALFVLLLSIIFLTLGSLWLRRVNSLPFG